jgi:3-oxoacyl-[acyl-carrier protein] reductase
MTSPRVLLITGTSRGIGLGLAEHYLAKGDIVCGCSRAPASVKHPHYSHFELDVSNEKSVVAMVHAAVRQHGRIDGLLNNAGIASMNHALLSTTATAQSIFATNFHGTFLFCREVAKTMVRQKAGRIVNFATVATPLRLEGESLYAASKAAVESFTEVLARELGPTGITVNAVGPTPVPTDLIKSVPKAKMDALLARQAIQRFGSIDDVINVIDFFLSPQSSFITGQVIYLGGVNG